MLLTALDPASVPFSPLMLADCLMTLAQKAEQAGYHDSASRLLGAAYAVLDDEKSTVEAA